MDSTEIPVYGQQEHSAYNKHYESTCYHPLLLFNSEGDCVAASAYGEVALDYTGDKPYDWVYGEAFQVVGGYFTVAGPSTPVVVTLSAQFAYAQAIESDGRPANSSMLFRGILGEDGDDNVGSYQTFLGGEGGQSGVFALDAQLVVNPGQTYVLALLADGLGVVGSVPEPSTLVMLGSATVGIAAVLRRRLGT